MATTASKNSFANGKLCASTRRGNTRVSLSRAMARWKFSVAEVPLSVAHTWTSNSRARKIELVALPHPSSSTRMPGLNGRWRDRDSAWHSAFSPRAFSRIQRSSYFAVRGKTSSSIKGLLQTAFRMDGPKVDSSWEPNLKQCSEFLDSIKVGLGRLLLRVLGVLPIEAKRGGCLRSEPLEVLPLG